MEYELVIDGVMVPGASRLEVRNPSTGEVVATCARANSSQLHLAVDAASRAQPAWEALGIEERRRRLLALAADFAAQSDDFARLLTSEQGKPLQESYIEIAIAGIVFNSFAAMNLEPETLHDDADRTVIEHRKALGVVAAITPWNYPLHILSGKVAPALLAGNTLVVKPAATTPLTTLKFGALCQAHLPPGVLNVIADDNDLGDLLTGHPDVDKVSFTGSTATGMRVMATAGGGLKRVTLELGGNDPAIVLADADIKATAAGLFGSAFYNAGQSCVAPKRIYAHASVYDALCEELAALARARVVGDGMQQGSQTGPLQNRTQYDKVCAIIDRARQDGTIIAGGEKLDGPGFFVTPTIVRDIPDNSDLVRNEQFGPVLPVLSFDDVEDAIERANQGKYGLGASVWSADPAKAREIAFAIKAGTVWVNTHAELEPDVPFRGAKQSGVGVELTQEGLEEYTQAHIVSVRKGPSRFAA